MLGGALEVLNNWALEKTDDFLVDNDDPITINLEVAKEIMNV